MWKYRVRRGQGSELRMRKTIVYICILLIPCCRLDSAAQTKLSPAVRRQVVERMILDGEVTRSCLKEAGGYNELVTTDYEHYNDDRVPEVVVVQKAGCISPGSLP